MKFIQYIIVVISLIFISCNKYLDVKPKGFTIPENTEDYNALLNGATLTNFNDARLELLTDNVDQLGYLTINTDVWSLMYGWAEQYTIDATANPVFWLAHYKNIYYYNVIIKQVMDSKGGDDFTKKQLYAEALLGRAYEYFYLANLYGNIYNSSTSSQDLCVPFVTSIDVTDAVPARSSVATILQQVVSDVRTALPNLPQSNSKNRFRGSKAAANSVLAKVYYYMDMPDSASYYAKIALQDEANQLIDYNTSTTLASLPIVSLNSQYIYTRIGNEAAGTTIPLSIELYRKYDSTDLRRQMIYNGEPVSWETEPLRTSVTFQNSSYSKASNFGTSIAEMKLIIAEAAALKNDINGALEQLNDIRENRIKTAYYAPLTTTDADSVKQLIADERRKELAFNGSRWFDMRLINKQGNMTDIVRKNNLGEPIATLKAGDNNKFKIQIPSIAQVYNPNW